MPEDTHKGGTSPEGIQRYLEAPRLVNVEVGNGFYWDNRLSDLESLEDFEPPTTMGGKAFDFNFPNQLTGDADGRTVMKVTIGVGGIGALFAVGGVGAVGVLAEAGAFETGGFASAQFARAYNSFRALKRANPAPKGAVWHHIVEQSQIPRFGQRAIQNMGNVVPLSPAQNQTLGDLYSALRPDITGSLTLTVRKWLQTKTFQEAFDFGVLAVRNVLAGIWP